MKKTIIFLVVFFFISIKGNAQTVSVQDSLALVALYNSTNGANWAYKENWLVGNVSSWTGITVSNGRVTEIYLSLNHLVGNIPPEIGNLSNLLHLYLSSNQLTDSIPPEIGNLSNLEYLDLDSNQLTGSIPSEIGNLSNLEYLDLSSNQLTGSIPSEIGNLTNLDQLYLDNNQLTGNIPPEIGNLSNLLDLKLSSNQLLGNIPPEIGNLSHLVFLNLSFNQLTGSIPPEIGNLTNLYQLYIYNNQLDELPNLSSLNLDFLDIKNNYFDFGDLERLHSSAIYFTYAPQAKIGTEQNYQVSPGDNLTLSVVTGGTYNTYQWYKDGIAINGATNNTLELSNIQLTDAGVYTCEVNNIYFSDLTLVTENYNVNIVTNTIDDVTKSEISIYPNPAHHYLMLKSDMEINSILIYNSSGQLILKTNYKEKIDISKFSKGIYIVKSFAKDNKHVGVQKLIVK